MAASHTSSCLKINQRKRQYIEMDSTIDWQPTTHTSKERLHYLFKTKKFSDCTFTFGNENEQHVAEILGHKLVLAMASPVFEAMFFGEIADNNKTIAIIDISSDTFNSILRYLYTEEIQITSVEEGYNIFYGAKMYMLPFLMEQCIKFFLSAVTPKNVVKLYEFSKFLEEKLLFKTCLEIIRTKTMEVLNASAFEDANLNTVLEIFDQNYLNIESELDLFNAVERYIEKNKSNLPQPTVSESGATSSDNNSDSKSEIDVTIDNLNTAMNFSPIINSNKPNFKQAIKKIRYLTLSSGQFAAGPGQSNLLTYDEILSILLSISLPQKGYLMPKGFTKNRFRRNNKVAINCVRSIMNPNECTQQSVTHCSLRFTTDCNISVVGIQVQAQVKPIQSSYSFSYQESDSAPLESMYACILDSKESVLTYAHYSNRNETNQRLLTISFNQNTFIKKNENYKVCVYFHKTGLYQITNPVQNEKVTCKDVCFSFSSQGCIHDGLIKGIAFHNTKNEV